MNWDLFVLDFFKHQKIPKNIIVRLIPDKMKIISSLKKNDYLGDCACTMKVSYNQKLSNNRISTENKIQIFISYAREDENTAKQIFYLLKKAGYAPWLDLEKLSPGQDWGLELLKALSTSDFVLICLSNNSIRKTGKVQKEWKEAIEMSKNYPEGSVFLIPLRLEDCEIPESLKRFQWIDLFEPAWLEKLLTTINKKPKNRKEEDEKMANQLIKENNKVEIEFINRSYELDEILNPGGPKLMCIDAPPGYGKSRLLDEVENWYQKNKKDDWLCVRIDFNKNIHDYFNNPLFILEDIARKINGNPIQIHEPQVLIGQMTNQRKNIILIFDAIESNPPAIKWLQSNFIFPLLTKIKLTILVCRVIFSGRYIQNPMREWGNEKIDWDWSNHKMMKLTVLDFDIVRQAIMNELKKEEATLKEEQKEVLAKEIAFLSGGHPGIIEKMLHNPPKNSWTLCLHENQLTIEARRYLFKIFSKPIIDNIIAETHDKNLDEILKILSIFRRFNFNTIRALQTIAMKKMYATNIQEKMGGFVRESKIQELLKPFPKIKDDALVVLANLVNTGLVSAPTSAMPYYHDAIIRKLILVQMQIDEDSGYYLQLHALAQAIYETWLEDKNVDGRKLSHPLAGNLQADFMVESLYHLLNCLNKDRRSQNEKLIKAKIRSYIKILRSSFETPKNILQDNLKSILKQDEDIPDLLRELLGEDGASRIFDLLG